MSLLPTSTRAGFRALTRANLPHTATASVRTHTSGAGGASVPTDTPLLGAGAPCRLTILAAAQGDAPNAGEQQATNRYRLTFAEGTELPAGTVVTVTGKHKDGSAWTRVVRVVGDRSHRATQTSASYECTDPAPSSR